MVVPDLSHKLPHEFHEDYKIRISLPCYLHYNMPGKPQFVGPPSSKKYVHSVKNLNFKEDTLKRKMFVDKLVILAEKVNNTH